MKKLNIPNAPNKNKKENIIKLEKSKIKIKMKFATW
jgi:hypothetical protein